MKKPRGLGKGLDALIPPSELQDRGTMFLCPLESIVPHPDQPRKKFDPEKLQELVQTIKEKGVLAPVIVRPVGRNYQLISGERRFRAAKLAGLDRIPALLRQLTDQEALETALIENLQREDLSPLEEARAYQRLLTLHDMTHDALAKRLGKDRSTITNALRLLKLSKTAQEAVENGSISAGHARCLLSIPPDMQDSIIQQIIDHDLSVRATEQLIKRLSSPASRSPSSSSRPSPHLEDIRNRLRAALSTQVKIIEGKRKGKIVIEYYTQDDLDRITNRILSSLGE